MEEPYEHLLASLYDDGGSEQYGEFGDDQGEGEPTPEETVPGAPEEEGEEPPEEEEDDEEEKTEPES